MLFTWAALCCKTLHTVYSEHCTLNSDQWTVHEACLNELQKEYCVTTKIMALDWQWLTLRSWCQMNRKSHSSPVKHKVDGKPHKILEKLKITSRKSTLFGHFLWSIFRSPVFTSVFLLIQMIFPLYFTQVWLCVDLIYALLMDIWWFCVGFGSCEWERKKQEHQVGFKGKLTFLQIRFLTTFMKVIDIFKFFYASHNFSKYLR